MKKLMTLAIAAVMALTLTACGGVDKTEATETFNTTNGKYREVSQLANDNIDKVEQDTVADINKIAESMVDYKVQIESEEVTQEKLDTMVTELAGVSDKLDQLKTQLEDQIAKAEAGPTDEQLATLDELGASMMEVHTRYAEHFDKLDPATQTIVNDMADSLNDMASVLDGSITLTSQQAQAFIEGVQQQLESAIAGWPQIEAQLAA